VISGGRFKQFREQLVDQLELSCEKLDKLHLFPTCGTVYYRFEDGKYKLVYRHALEDEDKREIFEAFKVVLNRIGYNEPNTYGEIIEDRGTQITFSALGQEAPYELKKIWDPDKKRRSIIKTELDKLIPKFEVRLGGTTSIDVTSNGIDKGYAVDMIIKYLGCKKNEMVFFGDALEPGGNDHAAYLVGVDCIPVIDHIDVIWKTRLILDLGF